MIPRSTIADVVLDVSAATAFDTIVWTLSETGELGPIERWKSAAPGVTPNGDLLVMDGNNAILGIYARGTWLAAERIAP